ncbi:tetratricopeptide repeat protein [Actinoplanes sp. CA-131856]
MSPDPVARVSGSSGFQIGDHNTQHNIGVDASTLPVPQATGNGAVVHNLPPASAVFEGRDTAALDHLLRGEGGVVLGQAAVYGLGGIGKSELANQYARAYADRYRLMWWITADNRQAVGLGLAALTARLHPVATLADAQAWALGWLQANTGWLLILDNVEVVADIDDLLGPLAGRGHVLVTTRRHFGDVQWRRLGLRPLRLEVLDRSASVQLLNELTGLEDPGGADQLADRLGDLPLGLQQAAAYIGQHDGMTYDDYAQLLVEEFDRAARAPDDAGQRTVAAVWTVTMAAIADRSSLAVDVLEVLAWLGADPLPEVVLQPLTGNPRDMGDALAALASYSMIGWRSGAVTVHRLVQAVTRSRAVTAGNDGDARDMAIKLLVDAVPSDPGTNVAGFPLWAALLPHVEALSDRLPHDHASVAFLYLLDRNATYQQYQGNYAAAVAAFERVGADTLRILGPGHLNALISRGNLAVCYRQAGRTEDAIAVGERVAVDSGQILGPEHPHTLTALGNLAVSYRQAGRTGEAIAIEELLAVDSERILGPEHPDTLISRGNLAASYWQAGRTGEAIAIEELLAVDSERILGSEHPHTLAVRCNLASTYRQAGRTADAIVIGEQVVDDLERILGPENPQTLNAQANLAASYQQDGRTAAAIALLERCLAASERILGPDHPDTAGAVRTLRTWKNSG